MAQELQSLQSALAEQLALSASLRGELEAAARARAAAEEEVATTRETMARREREAVEAVHQAAGRARQVARQEAQERLGKGEGP